MLPVSPMTMGIAAGCITIMSEVWYNWTIWKGTTRPDRMAWWVLSMIGFLSVGSHLAVDGGWSAVKLLVIALGTTVTAVLSCRHGAPFVFGAFAKAAILVVAVGMVAWTVFDEPLVTLAGVILVDGAAMTLNIRKAWRLPLSEAAGPWSLAVLSDLVNVMAIEEFGQGCLFPAYLLLTNAAMLFCALAGPWRAAVGQAAASHGSSSQTSISVGPSPVLASCSARVSSLAEPGRTWRHS